MPKFKHSKKTFESTEQFYPLYDDYLPKYSGKSS
jgi:hypothetical protein